MKKIIVLFLSLLFFTCGATGINNEGFIINEGQWPSRVLARAQFAFGDVIIEKDALVFFLRNQNDAHHLHAGIGNGHDTSGVHIKAHVYKMKFKNGTLNAPEAFNASSFEVNYLKGNTTVSHLHCYKKLIFKDLYPNIDLVLYANGANLKYDLVLRNNANYKTVQIEYEGLDDMHLNEEGHLKLKTSLGDITEKKPIAYIEHHNKKRSPVVCAYEQHQGKIRFSTQKITRAEKENFVIDPEIIFATYSGSTADNWGNSATYDTLGNLYAAGVAFNFGFPTTTGAYDITFNSTIGWSASFPDPDVAIMKFNAAGALIYATYLGGESTEVPTSTIVNKNGELYILGTTTSAGYYSGIPFPTTVGAYKRNFNGGTTIYPLGSGNAIYYWDGSDIFISRLSKNGDALLSSTYVGGSNNDGLLNYADVLSRNYGDQYRSEILLDTLGDVYIASHTTSTNILDNTKPGYDLTYNGGGHDGFVMKLNKDLTAVVWNSYIGGNGYDALYSLEFGKHNNIYVTGGTTSTDISMPKGLHTTSLGFVDGFIMNISNDGLNIKSGSYLGTADVDQAYFVEVDGEGHVYLLGQSKGNYPVLNAPYSNAGSQQFVHKLDSNLTTSIFSTVVGSAQSKTDIVPTAFLVNDCENIFIVGWGGSVNFGGPNYQEGDTYNLPLTANAYQNLTDGSDFYMMVLKKDLQKLLYGSYLGGNGEREHVDGGTSRFDKKGIVYQSVCAGCGGTSLFPVTPGAHSPTNNSSNCNNLVFKFDLASLKASFTHTPGILCGTGNVQFTNTSLGGSRFVWDLGDGNFSNSASSFTHAYSKPGTYQVMLIAYDETTCIGTDTARATIKVYFYPSLGENVADTVFVCKGDSVYLNTVNNVNYSYSWSPNVYLNNPNTYNPKASPPRSQYYYVDFVDNTTTCKNRDSVYVNVYEPKKGIAFQNLTGCIGKPQARFTNPSDPYFNFTWEFGDGSTENGNNAINHQYQDFGDFYVKIKVYNYMCHVEDTLKINIPKVNVPNMFTPNNDKLNDTYEIEGMAGDWKLDVYNKWGNLIFTRDPYDNSWNAEKQSGGVYYYLITDPRGKECKGWIHVIK
jgi:gliding motility-associated-like protein